MVLKAKDLFNCCGTPHGAARAGHAGYGHPPACPTEPAARAAGWPAAPLRNHRGGRRTAEGPPGAAARCPRGQPAEERCGREGGRRQRRVAGPVQAAARGAGGSSASTPPAARAAAPRAPLLNGGSAHRQRLERPQVAQLEGLTRRLPADRSAIELLRQVKNTAFP